MRLSNECPILLIGSKPRVYTIVVGRGITMISAILAIVGRVILQHRCKPQGCHAQLVEIVEMPADAFQVATMTQARSLTVTHFVAHGLEGVVIGPTVGKAVRHQHIEHVGVAETDAFLTGHLSVL